ALGFDRLSPNGGGPHPPFALSLAKGLVRRGPGFDKPGPNGASTGLS
ncbi:MAG: hypothetical protein RL227_128, partial [Pseudomonadota bacterium]